MFIYLVIFILASLPVFLKKNRSIVAISVIMMILVAGFRDMIGGFDVYIYGEVFELPPIAILTFDLFEWGFRISYFLLRQIAETRESMFFVFSVLILGLHSFQIKKFSPLPGLSLFIYFAKFYLLSFVYLRQGLAMGIVWLAIPFIKDKRYLKSLIILGIAFFFHKSSLVFVPFLFIANYRFSSWQIIIATVLLFGLVLSPLGALFTSMIVDVSGDEKLALYTEKTGGVNFFYLIEIVFFGSLVLKFRPYFYKNDNVLIINGFLVYTWVILFGLTNATFIRLGWYFFLFCPLALAYIIYYLKGSLAKKTGTLLFYVYYSLIFFRLLIVYDGGDFIPYKATFQNFERNGRWEFMEYRYRS